MDKEAAWLLNDKYGGVKSPGFFEDLKRLESGEPLAYVIGWIPFLHTKIHLDSKPLIPRPETEYWVEKAISELQRMFEARPRTLKVLDLCAGSGCIGVAVLKHIPDSVVHFAEIVDDHHLTIRKNIIENGIDVGRTKNIGGNLFENVTDAYDMILTNPPYIDPTLKKEIQKSVIDHEPSQALFGGLEGMDLIEQIIKKSPEYLNPNGLVYLEHEPEQVEKIKALVPKVEIFKDQFGVFRFSRFYK